LLVYLFGSVLLDEYGHATLTDFNIAVRYSEDKPLTAVAGSMAYMGSVFLHTHNVDTIEWHCQTNGKLFLTLLVVMNN
jgi:predicted nucleotidyltransferase